MKKAVKYFAIFVFFVLICFGFYLYKLHAPAVEGNEIFALRCIKVNPPLIGYKNSFLKLADYLKNPDKYTSDEARGFFDGYIEGMKTYVSEETKWLETQKKFMDSWDFKLIEPWYIKQAADYQWKMYEAYRDDAKFMLETYEAGEDESEIKANFQDARKRRDEYEQKYHEFFDQALEINDWRKIFGHVPIPEGCTKETLIIPNTSGSIDGEGTATPSPSMAPIDPPIV